ncbi:hypothetical protein AHF37_07001 [Paragonimus kellicotti]|nr:hypothetical protein AHF37_07001 [Paragonimus kellicotti]
MINHSRAQRCASPTIPDVATVGSPSKSHVMPPQKTTPGHTEGVTTPNTRLATRPPSYPSANSRTTATLCATVAKSGCFATSHFGHQSRENAPDGTGLGSTWRGFQSLEAFSDYGV